ncbi:MAG: DUF2723 domain-containing protein, partial [Chloroflexi bacterium]|nr:DUF2723 domain-containing protein [Chloroflexota bacterium]
MMQFSNQTISHATFSRFCASRGKITLLMTAEPTSITANGRFRFYAANLTIFLLAFIGGLAASRILYEGFFPQLLWLGRPVFALIFAAIFAFALWIVAVRVGGETAVRRGSRTVRQDVVAAAQGQTARIGGETARQDVVTAAQDHTAPSRPYGSLPFLLSPLALNLLWLGNPVVNLVESRLIFAAGWWLVVLLVAAAWARPSRWRWLGVPFVWTAVAPIYFLTMSRAVGRADTFEFQVIIPKLGIVHPTGYPLYLLWGKLFTFLPFGSVAWRINAGTAVFALLALTILYLLLYRLTVNPVTAVLGAVVTGLTVTLWSQAIVAEVYALHALIVVLALFLLAEIGDWRLEIRDWWLEIGDARVSHISYLRKLPSAPSAPLRFTQTQLAIALAFVLGLGMSNHVTTIFLIPPALLTLFFAWRQTKKMLVEDYYMQFGDYSLLNAGWRFYLKLAAAFALPLLLYAYLPLRWQAVNGEAMGLARFVAWVIGGRFQGALQLTAWLQDMTRYEIIGRLLLENWGWFNLALLGFGFLYLLRRNWRTAVTLLFVWLGYIFYALNYYVPDLGVFIIPAHLMMGIWWAVGAAGVLEIGRLEIGRLEIGNWRTCPEPVEGLGITPTNLQSLISNLLILPVLLLTINHWSTIDQSGDDGLLGWGTAVFNQPLAASAAILADSEKIAPLYYLQQAEGVRPDLEIMVLPDEAAYRAELDARLAQGQPVYLARFLPGLQGVYHLRSAGPLTEVSTDSLTQSPLSDLQSPVTTITFGPVQLLGYTLEPAADEGNTAVTLYWQTEETISDPLHVYLRWEGYEPTPGQHPVNDFYPTNAWQPGEIVPDYHEWPRPILTEPQELALQVALAPPFTPPEALDWQTITTVTLPAAEQMDLSRPYRAQIGSVVIGTADFSNQIRPQTPLPLQLSGLGRPANLQFRLQENPPISQSPISQSPITNLPISNSPFTLAATL